MEDVQPEMTHRNLINLPKAEIYQLFIWATWFKRELKKIGLSKEKV